MCKKKTWLKNKMSNSPLIKSRFRPKWEREREARVSLSVSKGFVVENGGHSQVTTCLITEWDVNVKLMKWNVGRLINDVIVATSHTDHGLITNYMMYLTIDGAYHEPSRVYYQLPIMSIFSKKIKTTNNEQSVPNMW